MQRTVIVADGGTVRTGDVEEVTMSDKSNPRALWMACGRGDVATATAQLASGDKIDAREANVSRALRQLRRGPSSPTHRLGLA